MTNEQKEREALSKRAPQARIDEILNEQPYAFMKCRGLTYEARRDFLQLATEVRHLRLDLESARTQPDDKAVREAFEDLARDYFIDDIESAWETWKAAIAWVNNMGDSGLVGAKASCASNPQIRTSSESPANCTCHPSDNPPVPCPRKQAYSECVQSNAPTITVLKQARDVLVEADAWRDPMQTPDDVLTRHDAAITAINEELKRLGEV